MAPSRGQAGAVGCVLGVIVGVFGTNVFWSYSSVSSGAGRITYRPEVSYRPEAAPVAVAEPVGSRVEGAGAAPAAPPSRPPTPRPLATTTKKKTATTTATTATTTTTTTATAPPTPRPSRHPKTVQPTTPSPASSSRPPRGPPRLLDFRRLDACPSNLKVYVYDYPGTKGRRCTIGLEAMRWYALAELGRLTCIEDPRKCTSHYAGEHLVAQFSLELILHDFFASACVRTRDPAEADLFFVPHYADVEYREGGRRDEPSKYEAAVLDIIERGDTRAWERAFNVTGEWWRRRGGADHILVQAAPVTGLRHPKGRRGFAHYLQQVTRPIWLSLELSRSFAAEYPACARKNVVVPYPIPGRHWHDGTWRTKAEEAARAHFDYNSGDDDGMKGGGGGNTRDGASSNKPLRVYYQAGDHGCVNVRQGIKRELKLAPPALGGVAEPCCSLSRAVRRRRDFQAPRQAMMHLATFCPCPEGDSPSAKRQYDALLAGCVPVLISDDALWAFDEAYGFGELRPDDFALRLPEAWLATPNASLPMLTHLEGIDPRRLAALQTGGVEAAHYYRYYEPRATFGDLDPLVQKAFPDGGALAALVRELEKRARGARAAACDAEVLKPHYALTKQYCGAVPVDRELNQLRARLPRAPNPEAKAQIQGAIRAFQEGRVFRHR